MRIRWILAGAVAAMAIGVGVAVATHVPQVDPATVPVGFLATHNDVANFDEQPFKRAVKHDRADVFVQHVRLGPGAATGWHSHPGPSIVTVVRGTLSYQDEQHHRCSTVPYEAGHGFVDQGFGHVHRAIAGPSGADFYVTTVLPTGTASHITPADPLDACS